MTETSSLTSCADCRCPCKEVCAILLMVLGTLWLVGRIQHMKASAQVPSANPAS
jgi:hypothetical protein